MTNSLVTYTLCRCENSPGLLDLYQYSTEGSHYLRTETDPSGGTSYTISGTSQLISVPYALHAKNAASYTETDPVFGAAPAKSINSGLISNWNSAYSRGKHSGLYKLVSYVPAWSEISGKPTSVAGYGISDAVTLTGNQIISGMVSDYGEAVTAHYWINTRYKRQHPTTR